MGDRISIAFRNGDEVSVPLFSHWDGMELLGRAKEYIDTLPRNRQVTPRDRREPSTLMVDFIRELTHSMDKVESNYYLCKNVDEGDSSDNGDWEVNVETGEATQIS